MFIILAFEFSPSVKIGICQLSQDLELIPSLIRAPANKALVTCSPEAKSTSSSLLSKSSEIILDCYKSSFVLPDIAETTAITSLPASYSFFIMFATCRILSIVPTEVPPNFNTFFAIIRF